MEQRPSSPESQGRSSWHMLVSSLYGIGANVVVIPEAAKGDPERAAKTIERLAEQTNYPHHVIAEYGDQSMGEATNVYIAVLSRIAITSSQIVQLGNQRTARNALLLDLQSAEFGNIRLLGLHLSDGIEEARIDQATSVREHIERARQDHRELIVAGDFNAMHRGDLRAHILRSSPVRWTAHHMPSQKLQSITSRLSGMAEGIALDMILRASVIDADPHHRSTTTPKMRDLPDWIPSVRLAQIDHILHTDGLTPSEYRIHPDGGSDHRPVSVSVRKTS